MELKVVKVHKEGGWNDEYVTLRVIETCDLGYYMIADTTYVSDKEISNKLRHTFWFPNHSVAAGDFVRLYTRPKRSGE